jgi:alpha-galactosidase
MTDEMLVAQSRWLPQYRKGIAAAQKSLAVEKPLGTRGTTGAARLKTKSVEELREDKRQGKPRT